MTELIIDTREPTSFVQYAQRFYEDTEVDVVIEEQTVGDFRVDKLIIERKEINDFVSSILDKRLHNQKANMVSMTNAGFHCYVIIVGNYKDIDSYHSLSKKAFSGAVASLNEYGIHTIFTDKYDMQMFFETISALIRKYNEDKLASKIFVEPDTSTWTMKCLMCIPGIGKETASNIVTKLPHLRRFYETDKEILKQILLEIDGVGEKTATTIIDVMYGDK